MNRRTLQEHCYKQPLTCVSSFWALVTLLFLNTVPAYAEWQAIEKDYLRPRLQTVYVDPDSIRREGNLVTLWQLIDFTWMQGNQEIGPSGLVPIIFSPRKPRSNLTAWENACGCWRSRSSHTIWELGERPIDM
ncbi:MAG: surface-adhesin E family protein [Nitrospirota bacterium]